MGIRASEKSIARRLDWRIESPCGVAPLAQRGDPAPLDGSKRGSASAVRGRRGLLSEARRRGAMYEGDPPRVSEERLSHLYWAGQHGITDDELRHPSMLEDEFLEKCKDVKRLELFMYSTMSAEDLGDFVNLQELSIQLQTVPRAVGLRRLVKLQRLSITDCGLESVAGVEACVQLRHLDVSQNRIEEMDPNVLQYLEELRTLWMNDNRLTRIEGLEPLTKLTTLWLARNQIAFICDALDNNLALTDLNLSANLVGNFKDIPHLSRLRHLKSLSFGDPHYGECPVCALCNYQTYVLFHVHHLSTLDSLRLTDEARQLAEATYMKKKMCAMRAARNSSARNSSARNSCAILSRLSTTSAGTTTCGSRRSSGTRRT